MPEQKPGKDFIGVGIGVMVRNGKGEFLLGKRQSNSNNEPGKWCFPGGTLEFGERVFDCAVRETKEETGLDVEPVDLVKLIDHIIADENQHWVNPIVEARATKGTPKVLEPNKMQEWSFFPLDNLPSPLTVNMVELFQDIKSGTLSVR